MTPTLRALCLADAKLIYATPFSTPIFQLTYCQAELDFDSCKVRTHLSMQPRKFA
jgi:hypothetical protein